ncbi:MAG: hypothetical protein ACFFDN_51060 [Candidatus Hodarchaeota archaeon]
MDKEKISLLLSKGPCIIEDNELKILSLNDIKIIKDPIEFEKRMDDPNYFLPNDRMILINNSGRISRRIPSLKISTKIPNKTKLNNLISDKYEIAEQLFLKQSELPNLICNIPNDETSILIVVDGLSFHDAKKYFECKPVFVDGPSLTRNGILRIIGKPTIAERLYNKGIRKIFGYSYWSREEKPNITGFAFSPIPPENLFVFEHFSEVIDDLYNKNINNSYIQIFISGLDEICHKFRDFPPIESIIKSIKLKFESIYSLCKEKEIRSSILLTSDHGILWKKDNEFEIIKDFGLVEGGPRWTKGKILRNTTLNFNGEDSKITSLKYPYITKKIRRNEWGVHGGISYEESIVPLISRVVC